MMRIIEKILFFFCLIVVLFGIIPYIFIQTGWGTQLLSQWMSTNTPYQIQIKRIEHSIFHPLALTLNHLDITEKSTQRPVLSAEKIDITLNPHALFTLTKLKNITITRGHLLTRGEALALPMPLAAEQLQLINTAVRFEHDSQAIIGENINGGVVPWSSEQAFPFHNGAQFRFTLSNVNLANFNTGNVFIQGYVSNKTLFLNNVGGDIVRGGLTTSIRRNADGSWHVKKLTLNNLQLQYQHDLDMQSLSALLTLTPTITLDELSVTNSSVDSPALKVNQFNAILNNLAFKQGKWLRENGDIHFEADDIVYHDEHFSKPNFTVHLAPDSVIIERASTLWRKGLVNLSGHYIPSRRHAKFDNIHIAKIDYPLPTNWLSRLDPFLFARADSVEIDKFTLTPSIVIDINPDFPAQFTQLEIIGNHLYFTKNSPNLISGGDMLFRAASATINGVPLRHVDVNVSASPQLISIPALSALTNTGLIEAKATLAQSDTRMFELDLSGHSINTADFNAWRLLKTPLNQQAHAQMQITGSLNALPNVNGSLTITHENGQTEMQKIEHGELLTQAPDTKLSQSIDNRAQSDDDMTINKVTDENVSIPE